MPEKQKKRWFALIVKPRHEKTVAQYLQAFGLEEYVPLYRARRVWSDRIKIVEMPLFAGYVFCRFAYAERFGVITTPGVLSVIGFAGADAPVADEEIEAIRAILASGRAVEPWAYLQAGDRIRIETGALAGTHGILVREKGACRVIVNIELLQRAVAVEVDRDLLTPLQRVA